MKTQTTRTMTQPTYNISAFAALAGVSTRTLRYYDRIGLLRPAQVTAAGYRVYGAAEVDRLQQILFYRELEVPLAGIAALLARPDFDRRTALRAHISALRARKQRLQLLIDTAEKSLATTKGESTMPIPATTASASEVCTARRTPARRFAPTSWAMTTVVPADSPTNRLTIRLISVPVVPPTAASACLPTNCPTIIASAVL